MQRLYFFNIDQLEPGDEITLEERSSKETYEYEVSEIFVLDPNAERAVDPTFPGTIPLGSWVNKGNSPLKSTEDLCLTRTVRS